MIFDFGPNKFKQYLLVGWLVGAGTYYLALQFTYCIIFVDRVQQRSIDLLLLLLLNATTTVACMQQQKRNKRLKVRAES